MRLLLARVLTPMLSRLGSRTILTVGGTLFVLNMLIPDPIPLVDEMLILAGTILLSRVASRHQEDEPAAAPGDPKPVGRGSTRAPGER